MTFHSIELAYRLFYFFLGFFFNYFVCFSFHSSFLLSFLNFLLNKNKQIQNIQFLFISLPEGFYTALSLCFYFALILSVPYGIYTFWQWAKSCIYFHERQSLNILSLGSLVFLLTSQYIGIYFVFPFILHFTLNFSPFFSQQTSLFSFFSVFFLCQFFSFCFCIITIGCYIVIGLTQKGERMKIHRQNRKFCLLFCLLFSAWICPPDGFSHFFFFLFFLFLFEFLIFIALITNSFKKQTKRIQETAWKH